MKRIKSLFLILMLLIVGLTITGCSGTEAMSDGGRDISPGYIDDEYLGEGTVPNMGSKYYDIDPDVIDQFNGVKIAPGQITASMWRDQDNYDFWLSLLASETDGQIPNTLFTHKTNLDSVLKQTSFSTQNMIKVILTDGVDPIRNATIFALDGINPIAKAVTNANGVAYLFPQTPIAPTSLVVGYGNRTESFDVEFLPLSRTIYLTWDVETATVKIIDLLFMVDTTGSMGDEINYLKAELLDVIEKLSAETQATIRLGFLFYRDTKKYVYDEYVTKVFDFSTDIASQLNKLKSIGANGGGDFPEAVDTALEEALKMKWSSTEASTKLIVHVSDAPPHPYELELTNYINCIEKANEMGIRIIPVACSGIDKWTEYLLRTSAILTGGTYVFITNDSGIGGDHIEATTGPTTVEYLNALLLRVISGYHTGVEKPGEPWVKDQVVEIVEDLQTYALINFNSDGGTLVKPKIVKKGSTFGNLPTPTKVGSIFLGWSIDGSLLEKTDVVDNNCTLVAIWALDE